MRQNAYLVLTKVLAVSTILDFAVNLALHSLFLFGIALIVFAFALDDCEFNFQELAFEVEGQRDKSVAFLQNLPLNLPDLGSVQEKLADPSFVHLGIAAVLVGVDPHRVKEDFAILNPGKGVAEVDMAFPDGLDFGAEQGNTGFVGLDDVIVVPRFAVLGDDLHAFLSLHDQLK